MIPGKLIGQKQHGSYKMDRNSQSWKLWISLKLQAGFQSLGHLIWASFISCTCNIATAK